MLTRNARRQTVTVTERATQVDVLDMETVATAVIVKGPTATDTVVEVEVAVAMAAVRAAMVDRADTVVTTAMPPRIHSCHRPLQLQLRMRTPKPMMRMPKRRGLRTTRRTPKQTLMSRTAGTKRI